MKKHLHSIEGLLELFSAEPWVFQPAELYKVREDFPFDLSNHNIYIIAHRNRITINPNSLKIENKGESVSGEFIVHNRENKSTYSFLTFPLVGKKIVDISDTIYPHISIRLKIDDGQSVQIRIQDIILCSEHNLAKLVNLKVDYIGQSYGNEGNSDAMTRLIGKTGKQGHGSLQKVLADLSTNHPDKEVHVLLYSYEFYKNFIRNSLIKTVDDFKFNETRFDKLISAKYERSNRIDLVEAGLIRYFEPEYNEIYKKSFPQKTHEMLQSLFDYDVTGLAISLSTEDHKLSLYSDKVEENSMHCPSYSIVKDSERASFLDL